MHAENRSVYGARKVWLEMRQEGINVARYTCRTTNEHPRARRFTPRPARRTTIADPGVHRADDLVKRKFNLIAPKMLSHAHSVSAASFYGYCRPNFEDLQLVPESHLNQ